MFFRGRGEHIGFHFSSLGALALAGGSPLVVSTVFFVVAELPHMAREGIAAFGFKSPEQAVGLLATCLALALGVLALLLSDARRVRLDGPYVRVESVFRSHALRRDALRVSVVAETAGEGMGVAAVDVTDGMVTARIGEAWSYAKAASFAEHLQHRVNATPAMSSPYRPAPPRVVAHDGSTLARGMRAGDVYMDDYAASGKRRRDVIIIAIIVLVSGGAMTAMKLLLTP